MTTVLINGKKYAVSVSGTGVTPCVCIGIGSLMQRTLSQRFKEMFTCYASDLYWVEEGAHTLPESLTMEQIVDDTFQLLAELKLSKAILLAHSCFGICALEAAKRDRAEIAGVILVATPPCWNRESQAFANALFEKEATAERKANDAARKSHFAKVRLPNESELSLNTYEASSARYWGDFTISRQKLEKLWNGIVPDEAITNHFYLKLLPEHDLALGIEKIKVPVVLAVGHLDYDSAPLALWKSHPKPLRFSVIDCGDVGHWPHIENGALFDAELQKWLVGTVGERPKRPPTK